MTKAEFNLYEIDWANRLLSQPAYTMPNGKDSHTVAYEVKNKAMDRMIMENPLRHNGTTWEFCA